MKTARKIIRQAARIKRDLKGETDFASIEEYLNSIGFNVIFFNNPVGDGEIERYSLTEKVQKTKAFTYCGSANIVFIDANTSPEDKTYILYHELGHIVLGHLKHKRMSTVNSILMDLHADTFACALL